MAPDFTDTLKSFPEKDLFIDRYYTHLPCKGCVLFLHGGGLLIGDRKDIPAQVVSFLLSQGWDVASSDYRVGPATTIPDALSDTSYACRYLRPYYSDCPFFLFGYSAGAYLALLNGAAGSPVDGICAFAGYGDLLDDWYYQPSSFFCKYKNVDEVVDIISDRRSPRVKEELIDIYIYLRQKGLWPEYFLGSKNTKQLALQYSPLHNLTSSYPPTVLIHGEEDNDVPASTSMKMANALKEKGLKPHLSLLKGMGHDLFMDIDNREVKDAWLSALNFLLHPENQRLP